MEQTKVYEYKNVYRTKDGTIKEYTSKHKKIVKNKINQKELLDIIRGIKDQEKLRQIKEFLEKINNVHTNTEKIM